MYCRVSTGDQDNDRQKRDPRAYAEKAGYEVVEVFRETPSGIRKAKGKQPFERRRAMALAQARRIDAVLVTELTRWGRSTQDLMDTLGQLASWDVSLISQTGLTFDLSTPQGRLIANLMASLAEFEHDLLRERVRSGIAAPRGAGRAAVVAARLCPAGRAGHHGEAYARTGVARGSVDGRHDLRTTCGAEAYSPLAGVACRGQQLERDLP